VNAKTEVNAHAAADPRPPLLTRPLQPVINLIAAFPASVHLKLLAGFLATAVLLVGMGVNAAIILDRMNQRSQEITALQQQRDDARQMLYAVTVQMHYRAMALLTHDDTFNAKIATAKQTFAQILDRVARHQGPGMDAFFRSVRDSSTRFDAASAQVLALYQAGNFAAATDLHLKQEHPISHELENEMGVLIDHSIAGINAAETAFQSDSHLLLVLVGVFSVVSVGLAMLLGFFFSWAIILPVRRIDHVVARVAAGDFNQRVKVRNRDEFGSLSNNINRMAEQLGTLYAQQAALNKNLEAANDQLQTASNAKSDFLAGMSHELRTPLNAIIGFTDALLAGVDGPLNEEQRASLVWVQRGGRDLLALISDVLDLSKIEAGKMIIAPEPFNGVQLVESVLGQHRLLSERKGLTMELKIEGAPEEVVLDVQRVRQILVNLVANAVKFTNKGGVTILVSGASEDRLVVSVQDTGSGIEARDLSGLFEEFRQVGPDTVRTEGTGLGLAISRRLARAMGGDITVSSTLGAGSTFKLTLPRDCRSMSDDGQAARAVSNGDHLLLAVDDDPSVPPLLEKMLVGSPYKVIGLSRANEVLKVARELRPDIITLDILMPERGGWEVLRELRSDPATRDIPVVVVTVVEQSEAPAETNADAYITKPLDRNSLLGVLAQLEQPEGTHPKKGDG
jgi:signal transduction histidine kinase/ActR/RegA family two-component response regulator